MAPGIKPNINIQPRRRCSEHTRWAQLLVAIARHRPWIANGDDTPPHRAQTARPRPPPPSSEWYRWGMLPRFPAMRHETRGPDGSRETKSFAMLVDSEWNAMYGGGDGQIVWRWQPNRLARAVPLRRARRFGHASTPRPVGMKVVEAGVVVVEVMVPPPLWTRRLLRRSCAPLLSPGGLRTLRE